MQNRPHIMFGANVYRYRDIGIKGKNTPGKSNYSLFDLIHSIIDRLLDETILNKSSNRTRKKGLINDRL